MIASFSASMQFNLFGLLTATKLTSFG